MIPPFIIYALPRSRTYWLSRFLSHCGWHCGHEEMRYFRGLDDVKSHLSLPMTGSAETAASPWWRLIQEYRPDIKSVVIRRDPKEVIDGLLQEDRYDRETLERLIHRLDAKLDQIESRVPDVLSIPFADLNQEAVCKNLFEFCLEQPHDSDRYWTLAPQILTIDLPAMNRYYHANSAQLDRLVNTAKQHIIATMAASQSVKSDQFTFQQEPFDDFLRDGERLFADHLIQVGEPPDAFRSKNIPLMRAMAAKNRLFVTTARSNGRMFGYLMSVVGNSLADPGKFEAYQTTFFISPEAKGIGLKLQNASADFLRKIGVDQLFFRAGIRGSGPRLGTLYRRMGATEFGQMYMLDLKESV
jgi:hypothetical protein